MQLTKFPETIQQLLQPYQTNGRNYRTESQAAVYLYTHPNKPNLFVKVFHNHVTAGEAGLANEMVAMKWLEGKLNVPQVIAYAEERDTEYLVTTELTGWTATSAQAQDDIPQLIRLLAKGLREIHATPYEDCPLDNRLDTLLARIDQKIQDGMVNLQGVHPSMQKNDVQELLKLMEGRNLLLEDIVFTHGDYCFPNILVDEQQHIGFIDWGYAGVGDRYRDFIAADYSIRRNLGDAWVPLFWQEYGLDKIDVEKLEIYQLLDSLA